MANTDVIGLKFGVEGGGSISGDSGRRISEELSKIVKSINGKQSTVPKVRLKFDVSEAKKAISDLKQEIKKLEKAGKITVSQRSSGSGTSGGKSSGADKKSADNYKKLSASVKSYYTELEKLEKIKMKSKSVSNTDGTWSTTDEQYKERVANINNLKVAYDKLGITVDKDGRLQMNSAKALGITEEQRLALLNQVQSATTNFAINNEKNSTQVQAAWDKNAAKVHDYILRMREVASKNPEVADMMDELDRLASSGDASNLDALTGKFAQLQQKIRESGSDVETWGQKMSKTLGTRIRSLLSGIVVGKVTQYLRQVYTNVVKLDEAVVNLQIASGKTREETQKMVREYADLAKQIGATTVEVANAADTWLRQGYSAEEAGVLIKNSMMLSKLGQMESAEASTALTSAMKGYGVSVQESIDIVDKFTKVDMEAAASAGDIATAMAETAASANAAGVSMDTLIGYIATVKEVTQDGAESVGTFMKTLFARMNQVSAGNFIDEETGEALNDVETVLDKLGISLRDTNGQFRATSDVLDEVAARWESFDSVEQHAIATAMAGTRQQEKFLVLMQNYEDAMKYAETATNSSGTAAEKYEAHLNGIAGKLDALTATFERFSQTLLDSDIVIVLLDSLTGLLTVLDGILSFADGFLVKVALVIAATVGLTVAVSALQKKLKLTITDWASFVAALKAGATSIGNAMKSLVSNPYLYLVTLLALFTTYADKLPAHAQIIVGALLLIGTGVAVFLSTTSKAINAFMTSNIVGWVLLGITAALSGIAALIKGFQSIANRSTIAKEKAVEAAKKSKEELEEVRNQVEELNKELESCRDRLQELQDLSNNGKITLVERQEKDRLEGAVAKLEAEKALLEDIEKIKAEQAQKDAANAVKKSRERQDPDRMTGFFRTWVIDDTTDEEDINEIIANWDNATSEERKLAIDYYNQISTQAEALTYHTGDNLEQWQKDANDAYNYYYELMHKMSVAQGNYDTVWNSALTMDRFGGVKELLTGVLSNGALDADGLKSLYDSNEQFKEFVDYLTTIGLFSWDDTDKVSGLVNQVNAIVHGADVVTKKKKSLLDIMNGIRGSYDALSGAIDDMSNTGILSADTVAKLLDPKEGFPGLEKYLTKTAGGYTIAEDAIDQFTTEALQSYIDAVNNAEEGTAEYYTAMENLENAVGAFSTLRMEQEIARATDALESEKEAWEGRLDNYKELIDIRKELIDSYVEELSYQNELEKKQQNLSNIQTRLAVARLDTSAAGQARVRELEAELEKAQEELDDITLEHAVDELKKQLDDEYSEYEELARSQIDEITSSIENVAKTINDTLSWLPEDIAEEITGKLAEYNKAKTSASITPNNVTSTPSSGLGEFVDNHLEESSKTAEDYKVAIGMILLSAELNGSYADKTYAQTTRTLMESITDVEALKDLYEKVCKKYGKTPIYHTGGFVGGYSILSSNEEFAKLLKGEFVSTPAQMKRFMEGTLPQIAGYASSNSSNQFNAPLVEINCDNVTAEAMPELKRVVDEAVERIQKQLDSGMSRTGFKGKTVRRMTI